MDDLSDEELMALTAEGEDDAFAVLVRRHQNLVFGTVVKLMGGQSPEAEDVAQQVFLRVYKAAAKYRPTAKYTTWLYTITRNCVFTQLKKQQRFRVEEPLPTDDPNEEDPVGQLEDQHMSSSTDVVLQKEMAAAIDAAIAKLPETQRMALVLRQYEQLDYDEIAQVLNTTVSSVKSLLFRARDTLRGALKEYLKEGEDRG